MSIDRISKLQEFLQQQPSDPFLQHALALEWVKLEKDDEAEKLFSQVLENHPDYVGSYYHLGKLLERNGRMEDATGIYQKGMAAAKKAGDNHAYNELQGAYEDLVY
jgi:tetratricopeptide (TPR) repeat protein